MSGEKVIGSVNIMPNGEVLREQFGKEFAATIAGLLFPAKSLWQRAKRMALAEGCANDDWSPSDSYERVQMEARQMREQVKRVHDAIWNLSMVALEQGIINLPADMPDEAEFVLQREGHEPESITAATIRNMTKLQMDFTALVQDKGTCITHFILTKLDDIEYGLFEPEDEWVVPEK